MKRRWKVEQDILNSFRKNGFELISPRFNHMRNFLTCLPFMAGKGLFKQLKEAGVVQPRREPLMLPT
ncbi:conjugal transfer ATP-binding protein TraC [Escherichia coli]|uniref:Conjugal transfer ATP-binding protein TraC n=1 Tax=Escherichia coli TaxID=562 RepID=A0A376KH13_ECOLX|nr:conjugal transfer ATP-binding protein TraC [Escherichia coli]